MRLIDELKFYKRALERLASIYVMTTAPVNKSINVDLETADLIARLLCEVQESDTFVSARAGVLE
jgi:hypothetical protein